MTVKKIMSDKEFRKILEEDVVLIDFNAPWCGPCHSQEPILESLAAKIEGKATVVAMNIDDHQSVAMQYHIQSIPTLIIFKKGNEIRRFVGLQNASTLMDAMTKALLD